MDCSMPGLPVLHCLCPLSQWCHPTISSSVIPFSCHQSFPASGSFPVSWLFILGGQSIGASTSVLFNEYSGLISFRIDWLDLLAVQATLKSLLQYHSSKASIVWRSAFFMVQLSHPYMTTGKTIALTIQTFVSEMMSLIFNVLPRFVTAFFPRSRCLVRTLNYNPPQLPSSQSSTIPKNLLKYIKDEHWITFEKFLDLTNLAFALCRWESKPKSIAVFCCEHSYVQVPCFFSVLLTHFSSCLTSLCSRVLFCVLSW